MALLQLFYNHGKDGNTDIWEREKAKKSLLLSYVLVTAVLLEGCFLTPESFEALKEAVKSSNTDLVPR